MLNTDILNTNPGTPANQTSTDEPETTQFSNHLTDAEPEPEPEPDIASLYRFCLWIDDYDYFADTPELSPNVLVFSLERAPDPLYEPNDSEFLPLLLEEIHRITAPFAEIRLQIQQASARLRAQYQGFKLRYPEAVPQTP
jgi:hypothetical protein